MSGTALAAGLGENNRRLAPYRSQNTIFNTNGGEPIFFRQFQHLLGCRHLLSHNRNGIQIQAKEASKN